MIIFKLFIIVIASFLPYWCQGAINQEDIKVTFFNVGQGNCTATKFIKGPPLLVDSGSSCLPLETDNKKTLTDKISDKLIKDINDWHNNPIKIPMQPDLNIIISHGDYDHYSFIEPILDNLEEWSITIKISLQYMFFLGGDSKDYPEKLVSKIKLLHERYYKGLPIFANEHINDPQIYCGPEVDCKILSMITDGKDKNRKSIVIKLTYDERSIILTGGATGATIESIIAKYKIDLLKEELIKNDKDLQEDINTLSKLQLEYYKINDEITDEINQLIADGVNEKDLNDFINQEYLKELEDNITLLSSIINDKKASLYKDYMRYQEAANILNGTILQASHHGANTDGSNSERWFKMVSPNFVVLSSGIRMDYLHPKIEVLNLALNLCDQLKPTEGWHSCHVYSTIDPMEVIRLTKSNDKIHPYIIFTSGYQILLMKTAIYNTIDQDDISFGWKKGGDIFIESREDNISPKTTLFFNNFQNILNTNKDNDKRGGIKIINLMGFELEEKDLEYITKHIPFLDSIRGINFANNKLGPTTMKYLVKLIQDLPEMYYFNIEGNNLKGNDVTELEINWRNRGLMRDNQLN